MASQQSSPAGSGRSAQVVGNAFVHQFFHILHQSPELVHRFYLESSRLGRPGAKGEMSTISSLREIDEKILAMDYSEYRAQIKTVDAQESLNGGVLVLVTGYLFGKDNVKRDFTQTFFLATQDTGYYVLNDIFRYVEEADQQLEQQGLTNEIDVPLAAEDDTIPLQEHHAPEKSEAVLEEEEEEDEVSEEEVYDPSEHDEESPVDEEEPVEKVINEVPTALQHAVAESGPSTGQEQKMSYASIVRVMKENPTLVSVATSALTRAVPTDTERQAPVAFTPVAAAAAAPAATVAPVAEVPASGSYAAESSIVQESEADGYSIYIKNLPLNATSAQLEEAFQKFGPIKPNGVQVRSNKLQGFCFGFVEFEVANAVQSAIEASPVLIGGRQAYVEEKRTNGSRANNRARFPPNRGGGFRGSYGGGRGYGRGDYNNRADFGNRGGRGGGASGRGGDMGYQRVDQMGSHAARSGRSGSLPRVPASA